ncbi:hypothetical protein ABFA07_021414 [Porites harrisoni]
MLAEEENLQSCLGFQNLKNVPPSGLNFSCQYVWCISIEQFVASYLSQVVDRGIVHWICRLNALYEVLCDSYLRL